VGVQAVRFAAPPEERFQVSETPPAQKTVRINLGLIRAVVYRDGGLCSKALEDYLRSLAR